MNRAFATKLLLARKGKRRQTRLPRPKDFKKIQREYQTFLLTVLKSARDRFHRYWPQIVSLSNTRMDSVRTDDWTDEVDAIFTDIKRVSDAFPAFLKQATKNVGSKVNQQNKENFKRAMKAALGVDVLHDDAGVVQSIALFTQQNVALIQSLPARYLDEVEGEVLRNFQQGRRAEQFMGDLEDRYNVAESRAALIARDQISKLNGALNKNRQESLGIEAYFWRTSKDERVRDSHRELEGQRILWSDPPEVGHPGEDFECRCSPDPDVSDLLGGTADETAQILDDASQLVEGDE